MLPEYDLSKLKSLGRGKYAAKYAEGTNVVLLEPDVAGAFPTSEAVNQALRSPLNPAKPISAPSR